MEKKILFPQIGGLIHGGDYNPEQWLDRPDILEEDLRLMKKAGINSASVGIFSWSVLEPKEREFHFEWLGKIIDRLYENGIYTVLATPSGARPAWLDKKYPEAMRVNRMGQREHHGGRHNHCMSSPVYREKVAVMDRKLAEAFGSHPGVIMYHISNEFSGECYCEHCIKRFRTYLAEKYDHDIEKLNRAWWTTFWSHRYNDFEQIEPPFIHGETSVMGLNLEWKRFTTWNTNDFMKAEAAVLHSVTPGIPVTANLMRMFGGLDYRKMAPDMDVVSWDNYPIFHNDWETLADTAYETAFQHALMRSLKRDVPFMMMESAPGLVNWQNVNKLKRPGIHRLACLQAVACGSDSVQYFQWRKGRGSYEQFHGAVVDHLGTDDTRVFKEVAEVGELLKKIAPVAGTLVRTKAAMLFDWDNRWAIEDMKALGRETKKYEETCIGIWKEFFRLGVDMDIVGSDEDLDRYDLVVAPMLYMLQPHTAANLRTFVERGGQLLATYLTGYVDSDQLCYLGGFPGDGLKDLFGIVSEEIDSLYPTDRNAIVLTDESLQKKAVSGESAGEKESCGDWEVVEYAEVLRVQDAQVLGTYGEDFYQGSAAITCKKHGKGNAWYVAARTDAPAMGPLFERMLADAGIPVRRLPAGVECHVRKGQEGRYEFYLNWTNDTAAISGVKGRDMVADREIEDVLELPAYGVAVVHSR
nr:beta-galactosidase [uncultured Acetatifactor sp.]